VTDSLVIHLSLMSHPQPPVSVITVDRQVSDYNQ